jgi:hypothetical protein
MPEVDVQAAALIQRRDLGPDAVALAHSRFDLVLVLANRCLLTEAYFDSDFDFDFAGQLGRWHEAY